MASQTLELERYGDLMNQRMLNNLRTQLVENKFAIFSIIVLLVLVSSTLLAFLSSYDPNKINILSALLPPGAKHFFGTDDLGRDYFTRALYGGRVSLTVGFMSMILSTTIGTFVGAISGYFGGKLDNIIMRIIDVFMCIPSFFLILIVNAYVTPGIKNIILIIGLFSWMGIARIVRAEALSIKEREYVLCAKALGADTKRVLLKHIIPNIFPSIIVAASINIASAILMESSLSFLGLGVQQPMSSWGSMLQAAQSYIGEAPNLAIFPGILILLTVLSFNVLGDVFRIAFEPKINNR